MKFLRVLLFLLVFGALAMAAEPTSFTLEQVLSVPFPTELVASPTGNRVAWLMNDQGRRNIWVAESPRFKARQLTHFTNDDGQVLTQLTWSSQGEALVFVRGAGATRAGETPNPTQNPAGTERAIWAVDIPEGVPRKLGNGTSPALSPTGRVAFLSDGQIWAAPLSGSTAAQQLLRVRGRSRDLRWSPDGETLAFVSDRNEYSFITLYQPDSDGFRYVSPSVDRDHFPRWSPDGKQIAFVRQPGRGGELPPPLAENVPSPWAIWVADLETLAARKVWESSQEPEGSLPRMAAENTLQWASENRLVFASEQEGWLHLYSLSSSGGAPRLLTPGECEVEQVAYSPDSPSIVYSSNCGDGDRRHLWRVPVTGGTPRELSSGESMEWNPAVLVDDQVAFLRSDARIPASAYLMSASGQDPRPLAPETFPKDFPSTSLVVPQQVVFTSPDGWKIHGQLFLPRGESPGKRPAMIYMHGGPIRQMLLGWHYLEYYHYGYGFNQYLASRGYAVLSVNYRGGVGYGRRFREAPSRGPRGASEYQDIVAGANYLRSREDIDPERIGLWGGSYGGYLTALGLARNSDLFAAGVDIHGVHDWSNRRRFRREGPGSAEFLESARQSSPVASVDLWKSPVLFAHGDDDPTVSFAQTVDLIQRLRARQVEFEQLVLPDEVHDFLLHRTWLKIFRTAADFLDRHLKK